ncbi:MAG: RHS repeat-associated core domain-containing protein [Fluviicola sp.]
MQMPDRQNVGISGAETYRYAYNGMEQDNEVSGYGNSYTTEFRQYDPRLGRWKSLDPLMTIQPHRSPYDAFNDNPIFFIDPLGLKGGPYQDKPNIDVTESSNIPPDDYVPQGSYPQLTRPQYNNLLNQGFTFGGYSPQTASTITSQYTAGGNDIKTVGKNHYMGFWIQAQNSDGSNMTDGRGNNLGVIVYERGRTVQANVNQGGSYIQRLFPPGVPPAGGVAATIRTVIPGETRATTPYFTDAGQTVFNYNPGNRAGWNARQSIVDATLFTVTSTVNNLVQNDLGIAPNATDAANVTTKINLRITYAQGLLNNADKTWIRNQLQAVYGSDSNIDFAEVGVTGGVLDANDRSGRSHNLNNANAFQLNFHNADGRNGIQSTIFRP